MAIAESVTHGLVIAHLETMGPLSDVNTCQISRLIMAYYGSQLITVKM